MKKTGNTENPHTYRTGSTNPPKSHRGAVTVLLILVIILVTITTMLSMMNIRLFRLLEEKNTKSLSFSETQPDAQTVSAEEPAGIEAPILGLTGQEIASLYRSYNRWPQGLYICQVTPGGPAEKADIRTGDIVIAMDGAAVSGNEDFQEKIESLQPGQSLQLTIFRGGQKMTISVVAE